MVSRTPLVPDAAASLGVALVLSSNTPLVLLDHELHVVAASISFCRDFGLKPNDVVGRSLFSLGAGEWGIAQLRSLLRATVAGLAAIEAYECELVRSGLPVINLTVHAHKLELQTPTDVYVVLAVTDTTAMRQAEKVKDDLIRDKQNLMLELQHRVANSLQIIASVLMQSARQMQSEEAIAQIKDAHQRVMSIATMQRILSKRGDDEVALVTYLDDLCASIGASMIADPKRLRLTVTCDNTKMSADKSVCIGLIVTELVINSLKHGFARVDPDGDIAVNFGSTGDDWVLSVKDNGVGMPDAGLEVKPGMGTGIVQAFAAQLDAVIVVSDENPGTLVTMSHKGDADQQISRLV